MIESENVIKSESEIESEKEIEIVGSWVVLSSYDILLLGFYVDKRSPVIWSLTPCHTPPWGFD